MQSTTANYLYFNRLTSQRVTLPVFLKLKVNCKRTYILKGEGRK